MHLCLDIVIAAEKLFTCANFRTQAHIHFSIEYFVNRNKYATCECVPVGMLHHISSSIGFMWMWCDNIRKFNVERMKWKWNEKDKKMWNRKMNERILSRARKSIYIFHESTHLCFGLITFEVYVGYTSILDTIIIIDACILIVIFIATEWKAQVG